MTKNSSRFVSEIQALRAIAVMVVFFYHLFPNVVTGGYVGVDIFFVISGYLMTQILLGELDERGRIDLKRFYFRRLRRIIPAATVVLLAVIVCAWFLLPVTMLQNLAKEVVASGLWVENWQLVRRATDYLAGGEDLSPVVHYWSLSIEEQFYLFYPLFLFLCWKAGPGGRKRMAVALEVPIGSLLDNAHMEDRADLIKDIGGMLDEADDDEVRLVHRLVSDVLR